MLTVLLCTQFFIIDVYSKEKSTIYSNIITCHCDEPHVTADIRAAVVVNKFQAFINYLGDVSLHARKT